MRVINPKVDRVIAFIKKKVNMKVIKTITLLMFIFLLVDCIISGFAVDWYLTRQAIQNNLDVPNKEQVVEKYNSIYSNGKLKQIIEKYVNDEEMVITYPNLAIQLSDRTNKRVREYLPDIKPYYFKFNKE